MAGVEERVGVVRSAGISLLQGRASEQVAFAVSPDGHWVAVIVTSTASSSAFTTVTDPSGPNAHQNHRPRTLLYLLPLAECRDLDGKVEGLEREGEWCGRWRVGVIGNVQSLQWSPDSSKLLIFSSPLHQVCVCGTHIHCARKRQTPHMHTCVSVAHTFIALENAKHLTLTHMHTHIQTRAHVDKNCMYTCTHG